MTENKGQQMRFSDEEIELMKVTYGGDDGLLKLLRKVFLPELDPTLPLGQNMDLWMTMDINALPAEEAKIQMVARNTLIGHIESQLIQLKVLANQSRQTKEQIAEAKEQDSAK